MHDVDSFPFHVPENVTLIEMDLVVKEQRDMYKIPTEQFVLARRDIQHSSLHKTKSTPIYFVGKVYERDEQGLPLKIKVLLGETTYNLGRACMLFHRWDALLQSEHAYPLTVRPWESNSSASAHLFHVIETQFGFIPYEDYAAMIDEVLRTLRPKLLRLARSGHIAYEQLYHVISSFYQGSDQWHQDIASEILNGTIDQALALHRANHPGPRPTTLTPPSVYMERSALASTIFMEADAYPEESLKYKALIALYEMLEGPGYSKEAILDLLRRRIQESEGSIRRVLRVHLRAIAWHLDEAPSYRLLLPTIMAGKEARKNGVLLLLDREDAQQGWYGYPLPTSHEEDGPSQELCFYSRQEWREKRYQDDEDDDYVML